VGIDIMKFLAVGCGSIGQRHLQNLKKIPDVEVIACRLKEKVKEIERRICQEIPLQN
jgi:saccharopine dehydrogenase-like NADP-dependent oxidoreductase